MVSCCKFDKDGKLLREKIKKIGEICRPCSSGKRYTQEYSSEDKKKKKKKKSIGLLFFSEKMPLQLTFKPG